MAVMFDEYIVKTPGTCGGKPRLKGHRIRVQDIVYYSEWCDWSPDQIADSLNISLAKVHTALAYYFENMEEIREHMREANKLVQEMKEKTPSKLAEKLRRREAEPESKSA